MISIFRIICVLLSSSKDTVPLKTPEDSNMRVMRVKSEEMSVTQEESDSLSGVTSSDLGDLNNPLSPDLSPNNTNESTNNNRPRYQI